MNRAGNLFEKICDIQNLHEAYYKASKNKRFTSGYINFRKDSETNLEKLRKSLLDGKYTHGQYRHFIITDPKQRLISAAPFPDRVMHHAIMNVLEPVFERQFIFHTYACRKGKGTHAAARYAFKCAGRSEFFLKLDVRKYFDSIDHTVLKQFLCRIIKDARCLELLFGVIDSYKIDFEGDSVGRKKGLPIGNLTSQFFANFYLSALDHFCLEKLALFLKIPVFGKTFRGVPFLGWRITKYRIFLLSKTKRRMKNRLKEIQKAFEWGKITEEKAVERTKAVYAARVC